MSKKEIILLSAQVTIGAFLLIFSYCYVDLNLTLTQNPFVLKAVSILQYLGYYQRPLATFIFISIYLIWFCVFLVNLKLFMVEKLSLKYLKWSVVALFLIFVFSYPFLSTDLYNYLFDAKIIAHYHSSPYVTKPLDYPNDEWLRFMRWTHRYSPYGPAWLAMSLFPFATGLGKFLLTFLSFKIFIAIFHLINALLIYKILTLVKPERRLLGTAFYGLNPLFLTEGIINAHNDVVLATSLLLTIYFLFKKKFMVSSLPFFWGVFIKYIPVLVFPWVILYLKGKNFGLKLFEGNHQYFVYGCIFTFALFTFFYSTFGINVPFVNSGSTQVQFQAWYLFWTLPLIALVPVRPLLAIAVALGLGSLLRYLPFLYYGEWSHWGTIPFMKFVTFTPTIIVIAVFSIFWLKLFKRLRLSINPRQ